MAWVLVLWFLPLLGIILYFFFGQDTRKERLVSQRSLDQLTKRSMLEFAEQKDLRLPESHRPLMQPHAIVFDGSRLSMMMRTITPMTMTA